MKHPTLLTVKETSEYLRIPAPTVYYLIRQAKLPAIQIGKRWRIRKELIDRDILHIEDDNNSILEQPGSRALILDPVQQDSAHLGAIIGEVGIDCDVASTYQEAKAQAAAISYPIVFLKTQLPDENTVTAFQELQAALPNARMVLIAADAEDDTLTAILSRSPVTILLKPFKAEHVHSMVKVYASKALA